MVLSLAAPLWAQGESPSANEIPFAFRDGLIWIDVVTPQSPKPLHFLLDSGASVSVLHLSTARRLGMKLGPAVRVNGVGSTSWGHWPQRLNAKASGVELPVRYLTLDLTRLSNACATNVDGLLGADFFRNRTVQIDFDAHLIRLLPANSATPRGVSLEMKKVRGAYLAPVTINGSDIQWLRVDTGCNSALQWVNGSQAPKALESGISVALSGEFSIPITTTTVRLGSEVFEAVPTGLHDRTVFRGEDGLLGSGLLSRFALVTLDTHAGKLILSDPRPGP